LKRGIKKYGSPKNMNGEKMREMLETLKDYNPLGISGPITYSRVDHQGATSLRIVECKDNKLVPVSGFIPAAPMTPEERDGKYWLTD